MDKKKNRQSMLFGMPMNWQPKNFLKDLWNAQKAEVFPVSSLGVGWTINFHALLRSVGVIKAKAKKNTAKSKPKKARTKR